MFTSLGDTVVEVVHCITYGELTVLRVQKKLPFRNFPPGLFGEAGEEMH